MLLDFNGFIKSCHQVFSTHQLYFWQQRGWDDLECEFL